MRAVPFRLELVVPSDARLLANFLTGSEWPYHHEARVDASWVRGRLETGYFFGKDTRAFWIYGEPEAPVGLMRLFDLEDVTPLFDLRVAEAARGQGVGTWALDQVTQRLFTDFPQTDRLGGYTRHDNSGMRRVFEKCGYTLEALHRRAWRRMGAAAVDSVGYAILREEAEQR